MTGFCSEEVKRWAFQDFLALIPEKDRPQITHQMKLTLAGYSEYSLAASPITISTKSGRLQKTLIHSKRIFLDNEWVLLISLTPL